MVFYLNFPTVVYKKLLKIKTTIEDIKEIEPEIYKNLLSFLDFEGDVEKTFC